MPKNVSKSIKVAWFEKFEGGESIAKLARDNKRDPRTVQRAVEEIRLQRQTYQAQTELLKEALKQHQNDLFEVLGDAIALLGPLPFSLELHHAGVAPPSPLKFGGWTAQFNGHRYVELDLEVEEEYAFELLKEHLGRDRAFVLLKRWKQTVLDELNAQLDLRNVLEQIIVEELKLTIGQDVRLPGMIRPSTLSQLFSSSISHLYDENSKPEPVLVSGQEGEFFLGGSTGGRLPSDSHDLLERIQSLPKRLSEEPQAKGLRKSHEACNQAAKSAKQSFREIQAAHFVPNSCPACRRYQR